jgi:hypothetical protein
MASARPSIYLLAEIGFATWIARLTVESLIGSRIIPLYSTLPLCPPEDSSIFNAETNISSSNPSTRPWSASLFNPLITLSDAKFLSIKSFLLQYYYGV